MKDVHSVLTSWNVFLTPQGLVFLQIIFENSPSTFDASFLLANFADEYRSGDLMLSGKTPPDAIVIEPLSRAGEDSGEARDGSEREEDQSGTPPEAISSDVPFPVASESPVRLPLTDDTAGRGSLSADAVDVRESKTVEVKEENVEVNEENLEEKDEKVDAIVEQCAENLGEAGMGVPTPEAETSVPAEQRAKSR